MYRKPIRTYQRRPQPVLFSPPQFESSEDLSVDTSCEDLPKVEQSDSLNDPFESTFDRVAKTLISHPPPSPAQSGSIVYSSDDESRSVAGSAGHLLPRVLPNYTPTRIEAGASRRESLKRKKKSLAKVVFKNLKNATTNVAKKRKTDELMPCRVDLTRISTDESNEDIVESPDVMSRITKRKLKKQPNDVAAVNDDVNSELTAPQMPVCFVDLTRVSITHENPQENEMPSSKKGSHVTRRKIRRKTINIDDSDDQTVPEQDIKPCAVELIRLDDAEIESTIDKPIAEDRKKKRQTLRLSKDEKIELNSHETSFGSQGKENKLSKDGGNLDNNSISSTKKCQVILPRVSHLTTRNMNAILSSTPFEKGVSSRVTLKLSPIVKIGEMNSIKSPLTINSSNQTAEKSLCDSSLEVIESSVAALKPLIPTSKGKPAKKLSESSKTLENTEIEITEELEFNESTEVVSDTFANTTEADSFVYRTTKKTSQVHLKKATPIDVLNKSSPSMFESSLDSRSSFDASKTGNTSNITESDTSNNSYYGDCSTLSNEMTIHQSKNDVPIVPIGSSLDSTGVSSIVMVSADQKTSHNDSPSKSMSSLEMSTEFSDHATNSIDSANSSARNTSENEEDYSLIVSSSGEESGAVEKSQERSSSRDKTELALNLPRASVILTRLENSVMITNHRDKYRNWKDLNVSEDSIVKPRRRSSSRSVGKSAENEATKRQTQQQRVIHFNPIVEMETVDEKNISEPKANNNNVIEEMDKQFVYLQPGKSWARSLSILKNIHNDNEMEILSVGKGQKWRQSVRDIFKMQLQGQRLSCGKVDENGTDDRKSTTRQRQNQITRLSEEIAEVTSPSRFVRRVSIRVVPNDKRSTIVASKDVDDLSFLEVYGISTNREVTGKKSLQPDVDETDFVIADTVPTVSPRNVVLQKCGQVDSLPFEECYPDVFLDHCRKVGEGVYGEVFLYENKEELSVIKLIPIEGKDLINGEPQKKFNEILSEIIIAKELHNLRFHDRYRTNGFVEVKNIRCVEGKYPQKLVDLWRSYDEEKKSENDCPSIFKDGQLYISLELAHGGQDMEAFVFQNASEPYTLFIQTALTLAVAEKSLEFEHRDLHWGNILISRTNEPEMIYKFENEEIIFPCNGIKVAIIDFTLSRMSYQNCCMYNDLALDPALFTAKGEYQFEIYRLMQEKVGNNWQLFEPYTNILWLHYILEKMISEVRYKRKTTKIHKTSIQQLKELRDIILNYNSAFDFISNCNILSNLERRKCL